MLFNVWMEMGTPMQKMIETEVALLRGTESIGQVTDETIVTIPWFVQKQHFCIGVPFAGRQPGIRLAGGRCCKNWRLASPPSSR